MSERQFLAYCFKWWADFATFTLDIESYRLTDMSDRIPPEGWVP